MERCKACLSPLPDSKERRSLVNPKSHIVRNGLIQLSSKIDEDTSNCKQHFSHGYVCKKCFNLVNRYINLSNNLAEMEKTILGTLSSAFGRSEPITRGMKRSSPSLGTSTPKRIRIDNNSESSSVVVS